MEGDAQRASGEGAAAAVTERVGGDPLDELARLLATLADLDLVGRYAFADATLPLGRVLDAGCGDGRGAAILAHRGRDVVAVDRAPSAYEPPSVRITRGDLTALDADDGSFVGIACLDVLDDVEDPRVILAELQRTLAREGVLVASLRLSRAGTESAEAGIRHAFAHVRDLDGGPVLGWRAGSHSDPVEQPPSSNGQSVPLPHARRFLVASAVPMAEPRTVLLSGKALDADGLQRDWTAAVQIVRELRVELAQARDDLAELTTLRHLLLETEQEVARLPDLRNMLRTVVAERDELHDLLRRAIHRRAYPQLGIVIEALREAGLMLDDDAREALHAVLAEFDRRSDLQKVFSHAGLLRLSDLIHWALHSPANDTGILLIRRHRPALTAIWDTLGGREAIVVPITST